MTNRPWHYREELARLGLAVQEMFPRAISQGAKRGLRLVDVVIELLGEATKRRSDEEDE